MPAIAYVNGIFGPISDAKVSVEDRGFQFGDAVYEVIAVYDGQPFLMDDHLARLERSAAAIELHYDFSGCPLRPIIDEGIRRSGVGTGVIYIQLTRGSAPRTHEIPKGLEPTLVLTFRPVPPISDDLRTRGITIQTTPEIRWAKCSIKAVTLLPNILAKAEAAKNGYDDALFVAQDGEIRECTSSNIYRTTGGRVLTPLLTESILHGITQRFLMGCAKSIDVELTQQRLTLEDLLQSDEVFVSNTRFGILGVTAIDGVTIGTGTVGPITQRLFEVFTEHRLQLAAAMGNNPQ